MSICKLKGMFLWCKSVDCTSHWPSLGRNIKTKAESEKCIGPKALKPYDHVSLFKGLTLVFHEENPPPTHFLLVLLCLLLNHCMNLHAQISSIISEPVFSLFLCPSHFPSLSHLGWCTLTALSETWDVYGWTARMTTQNVCVWWWGEGFYWNHHAVKEMSSLSQCVCVCVSLSGGENQRSRSWLRASAGWFNCVMPVI